MTKRPTSLSDVMARKTAPPVPAVERSEERGVIKTLTIRLPEFVHDQLREMSFTSKRSQHDLLMEALNDLFAKNGKPPTAPRHP